MQSALIQVNSFLSTYVVGEVPGQIHEMEIGTMVSLFIFPSGPPANSQVLVGQLPRLY